MKIRGDFVTNSSSVSYILTMNEDTFDVSIDQCGDSGTGKFLKFVKEKIKNEGTRLILNNEEIYSLKITFVTDEARPIAGISDDGTMSEFLNVMRDFDINNLSNEELNSFLYWTILYPNYISNIGATRVRTY